MTINSNSKSSSYSPLYFLTALGAGGLSVTFFLYLLFWVPHVGRPVPNFEDISAAFLSGTFITQAMIVFAMTGIAVAVSMHIKYLVWNLRKFSEFKKTVNAGVKFHHSPE